MADMGLNYSETKGKDHVPGYPEHVNEALYLTLSLHTACCCRSQHLGLARLRLDSNEEHEHPETIPFEILFTASPDRVRDSNPNSEVWHEAKILVSR
jgi:hypothetical protein